MISWLGNLENIPVLLLVQLSVLLFNTLKDIINMAQWQMGIEVPSCDGLFYVSIWLGYHSQLFNQTWIWVLL